MAQVGGGEIAEVQLLELFLQVNADIDRQFQFWISVTFAVLVASFVADERLSRLERGVISTLYLCAAGILLYRYLGALTYQLYALDLFTQYGVEQPTQATTAFVLRFSLFTFGSLVAALSVLFPRMLARRRGRSASG